MTSGIQDIRVFCFKWVWSFCKWIVNPVTGSKTYQSWPQMAILFSTGGPSVAAVKGSISCSFPPSSCSYLGWWCWQQGQLWHGNRSVCFSPSLNLNNVLLLQFSLCSMQGKQEDSLRRVTWWSWWRAGSQGPVTPTSWGQWASSDNYIPDLKYDPRSALGKLSGFNNWWWCSEKLKNSTESCVTKALSPVCCMIMKHVPLKLVLCMLNNSFK